MTATSNLRIVAARRGPPAVLRPIEEAAPVPGAGQVLVRVLAAGVGWADVMMREGVYPGAKFPLTPGYDIVGVVEDGAAEAGGLQSGETVAALTVHGGYSRYIVLPASELVRVPAGLDPVEAVSLVLNFVTAYQMLHRCADVSEGDTILVHGAAGGVGTALLQLARLAKFRVIGTSSSGKAALVTSLGASHIDYRTEDFVARTKELCGGAVAAFDPIGGAHWKRSYAALRPSGILVAYGASTVLSGGRFDLRRVLAFVAGKPSFAADRLLSDGKGVTGYTIVEWKGGRPAAFRADLAHLFELLAARAIEPIIAERIPLAEAARAHELLGKAQVTGKIVLV
jgi:NADPH2:quinone reductase